jgi:5,10-methylenetetrahydrofolate reductase
LNFREAVNSGKFVITVEVAPPRGTDYREVISSLEPLKGKVDAFNVTDCQRSMVRMSALSMAKLLLDSGYEPVLQMTCRDRNRIALQSELLGAWALGVENLCLMTGDFTTLGDQPDSKPVFDLDSVQLIELARTLNSGKLLNGKELNGKPSFFIGAVHNPFAGPELLQTLKLKKKVEAGARFIQTQPVYELKVAREVHQLISSFGAVPLIGLLPIKSLKMANFMKKLNPTSVPSSLIEGLEKASNPALYGWEYTLDLARGILEFGSGVHFMLVGRVKELADFIDELRNNKGEGN